MERVWEGSHVYIYYTSYIRYSVARDFTDRFGNTPMHIGKQKFFAFGYGTGFVKGSPYLYRFDKYFQQLIEAGLIEKWTDNIFKKANQKPPLTTVTGLDYGSLRKAAGPTAFSLEHLKAAFYLYLLLLAISLAIFIIELLYIKLKIYSLSFYYLYIYYWVLRVCRI